MTESNAAFWCRIPSRPNFGDALTPWLIRRIGGREARYRPADNPRHKYLVTGSVITLARAPVTVWGSGIMDADDRVDPGARLLAVRGPLTRDRAHACGADCPPVYGDPALLLPRLHSPRAPRPEGIALAPHFSDRPRLLAPADRRPWLRVLDMQRPVETVIADIRACTLVVATSLHGLIVAHAYGVPAVWLELRPLPSGDGSKFRDYLASIGCDREQPLRDPLHALDPARLRTEVIAPPTRSDLDLDPLWACCPFRSAE